MALQASVPPGGAEADGDVEEAVAVAEAGARTEAEAPTGAVNDGEAVAGAEAGEEGRLSDAVGGKEPPGEQPHEAGAAWSPCCWPVSGGWRTPGL